MALGGVLSTQKEAIDICRALGQLSYWLRYHCRKSQIGQPLNLASMWKQWIEELAPEEGRDSHVGTFVKKIEQGPDGFWQLGGRERPHILKTGINSLYQAAHPTFPPPQIYQKYSFKRTYYFQKSNNKTHTWLFNRNKEIHEKWNNVLKEVNLEIYTQQNRLQNEDTNVFRKWKLRKKTFLLQTHTKNC